MAIVQRKKGIVSNTFYDYQKYFLSIRTCRDIVHIGKEAWIMHKHTDGDIYGPTIDYDYN